MKAQLTPPGEVLRSLRSMANLTLKEVAVGADTAVAYLSKVETGSLDPSTAYVAKVAEFIVRSLAEQTNRASTKAVA